MDRQSSNKSDLLCKKVIGFMYGGKPPIEYQFDDNLDAAKWAYQKITESHATNATVNSIKSEIDKRIPGEMTLEESFLYWNPPIDDVSCKSTTIDETDRCASGFLDGDLNQPCIPVKKIPESPIQFGGEIDENGVPLNIQPDITTLPPKPLKDTSKEITDNNNEVGITELCDPNLQLALEYYVELDCPDININCVFGIDQMQTYLSELYDKLIKSYRESVNEIEIKLAELLSLIESKYAVGISEIEQGVNNFYFNIVFNPETTLLKIENHIDNLCKLKEIPNGKIILPSEDQTDEDNIGNDDISGEIEESNCNESNGKQVVIGDGKVLSLCCDKLPSLEIYFREDQLDKILKAISLIGVSVTNNKTTIEKADNVVCEGKDKNEDEYSFSVCYDRDLAEFEKRTDFENKLKKFKESNLTTMVKPNEDS